MRTSVYVLVLAAACGGAAKPKQHAAPGDLAIVGATVIPFDRAGELSDQTVVVRDGAIALVAPEADVDVTGATVVDAHGKFVLPGLADMHVHFWSKGDLPLFLLEGVTTVRNLFGSPQHLAWRDAVAKGTLDGPTIITSGPILDGDPPFWPGSDVVTTADAARAAADRQHAAGYDWLKVYNNLPKEAYDAIIDEGRKLNMFVGGHVPTAVGIAGAIAAGQRSIEHLDGYVPFRGEPTVDASIIDATVKAGVWNCPTLVVTDRMAHMDDVASLAQTRGLDLVAPSTRAQWDPKQDFRLASRTPAQYADDRAKNVIRRKLVADLAHAGAKLVLGTDTGNPYVVPGFAVGDELQLLVTSGLSPYDALRMATAAAAELEGTPGAFGVVAPGARADLIVVDRDPTSDVTAVFDPAIVIARGKLHTHADLLAAAQARLTAPADRFADLPPLAAPETARYQYLLGGQVIGEERAAIAPGVVDAQGVMSMPVDSEVTYHATPDRIDMTGDQAVTVTRTDTGVRAVLGTAAPIDQAAPKDAVIGPAGIAEFVWYADRLADLAPGASRSIDAVEVMADSTVHLEPAQLTFVRKPDDGGRRVYAITGKEAGMALTGTFTVDADGTPRDVTLKLSFGVFEMKRE